MKAGTFLTLVGLLLAFGGVGGVEHSMTNLELASSTLVAMLGLATMYCGNLMLKINEQ